MTFLHRLAKRIAGLRVSLAPLTLLLVACGLGDATDYLAPSARKNPVAPSFSTVSGSAPLSISPRGVQLPVKDTLRLAAWNHLAGADSTLASVQWSVPSGAQISSSGLFKGTNVGTYRVTAKSRTLAGVSDTTSIVVVAASLTGLLLYPESVNLQAGQSTKLAVKATWNNGTTSLPPLSWSATGGTIKSDGQVTRSHSRARIGAAASAIRSRCSRREGARESVAPMR